MIIFVVTAARSMVATAKKRRRDVNIVEGSGTLLSSANERKQRRLKNPKENQEELHTKETGTSSKITLVTYVTTVHDHFLKHGMKRMLAEHEKDERGDRPRRDWYDEECRMHYPNESDYYSDRSSDRERRRLRDIEGLVNVIADGRSRSRAQSDSNSVSSSNRVEGRTYSDAVKGVTSPTSSQGAKNHSSPNISLEQLSKDLPEVNQQLKADALKQTGSDDHSNVAMITVDSEADSQLTLQPISWRHSTAKGHAEPLIRSIPGKITPFEHIIACGNINVKPENHRFLVTDDQGRHKWRASDFDGNLPLDISTIKYENIPLYYLTTKCGADFLRSNGFSIATIGEHDITDWKDHMHTDPNYSFDPVISLHPLKQPRATCINGIP
jgi:hypothetical protein